MNSVPVFMVDVRDGSRWSAEMSAIPLVGDSILIPEYTADPSKAAPPPTRGVVLRIEWQQHPWQEEPMAYLRYGRSYSPVVYVGKRHLEHLLP